ncbi:MAG: hypothetical protein WKF43_04500 [Acidimicrobiales bacterium]
MNRPRIGARARTVPGPVWAAVALFVVLRLAYASALPAFESPDEYAHLDLVEHVAGGRPYPAYDGKRVSAFAQRAFVEYSCSSKDDGRAAGPAPVASTRWTLRTGRDGSPQRTSTQTEKPRRATSWPSTRPSTTR